ncbi:MAG: hypothetical protein GTO02_13605 [Candidatus Dadabacteria bacterium]|nr:hypothetical protein [Candidatus Dadabacteria bacterium]
MIKKQSKTNSNVEVDIDIKTKEIKFNNPNKEPNTNFCYFINTSFILFFMILTPAIVVQWSYANPYYSQSSFLYQLLTALYAIAWVYLGSPALGGYISIFLHKRSKWLRKMQPYTAGLAYIPRRKKEIDLSQKYSKKHYIDNNQLILMDYKIMSFKYKYEGEIDLLRITTHSVEPEGHKGEHYKFVAIFTFAEKIRNGTLTYW